MPLTRSATSREGGGDSREGGGDSGDEMNNTIYEQPARNSQSESTIETRLNDIMEQIRSLQGEIQRIRQPQNGVSAEANQAPNTARSESVGIITTASSEVGPSQHSSSMGRLHKLYDLPEFDGRPEDWPMFKETLAMTTTEYNYTHAQNMMRLQKAIKGRARETVECLLIHSRNVPQIMGTLQERFGRPELLVKSQISKIRSISPISENHLEQLTTFATKVHNLASFLEAADCDHHLSNPTLMEELLTKLPVQRRIEWARYAASIIPRPTICHFSTWLQELSKVISSAFSFASLDSRPNRSEGRTRFFYANENNARDDRKDVCQACFGKHTLSKCNKFLSMNNMERWQLVRRKRVCFNCLKGQHRSNTCSEQHECDSSGCTRKVHGLLHNKNGQSNITTTNQIQRTGSQLVERQQQQMESQSRQVFTSTTRFNPPMKLLFKILPVVLYANGHEVKTYAFLDEGSAISLINWDLAKRMGLKGKSETLTLQWFGNATVTEASQRVDMFISGIGQYRKKFLMQNVRTVSNLELPRQTMNFTDMQYKHRNLPVCQYENAVPELLIGLDNAHLGISKKTVSDGSHGYAVVQTKLGWIVYGTGAHAIADNYHTYFANISENHNDMEKLVNDYIVNENVYVKEVQNVVESSEISKAKRILEETTKRVNGSRFETGLLWKNELIELPPSRKMAERRFYMLEKRFESDAEFKKTYTQIMADYEKKGYCRKLTEDELNEENGRAWYLPHFGVYNPNKPGKLRLVFDAAAKVAMVSLNSVLIRGPDLTQPLAAVLMKFRQKPVGVCADISEMFHQVRIRKEDQQAQRFLWRYQRDQPLEVYVMNVMIFGATCSPCSAQFVKNKNAENYEEQYPAAVTAIIDNHYVDDFVHCFSSSEEALRITKQVIEIHRKGGFELRGFASNSKLITDLNENKATPSSKVDPLLLEGKRPTKREVLKVTMSLFDPFGIAAEYTLEAKLILQAIWREHTEWDDHISSAVYERWKHWLNILTNLRDISVPRCYGTLFSSAPIELHVFADASESAYVAVAYWRIPSESGKAQVTFIAGKTKCAPLKLVSIPRLELQSAVLATRLRQSIVCYHTYKPSSVFMWSDSKTVISWIKSDYRRYKPYVAHRVNEILEESNINEWRWLASALNPADFGTRQKSEKRASFWISGPEFLTQHKSRWPPNENCNGTELEIRNKFMNLLVRNNCTLFTKFSSFMRLKRVVGWIFRFRNNCLGGSSRRINGHLRVHELRRSEEIILRKAQMEAFPDEYNALSSGNYVDRRSSLLTFSPYLDEAGLIRVGGRIDAAEAVPLYTRRPIILPKQHCITELVIDLYHKLWKHQNESLIVAELRRRYCIPNVRREVRRAAKRCQACKNSIAMPSAPMMGQLPPDRVTPFVRPFSYTGLDYMGPFKIVIGRRIEKRWIVLFTCLTIRAIHLEIVKDLSTDSCLMSIRNFMNRRGTPIRIRSDNASTFVGANNEFKRQLIQFDNNKISDALSTKDIQWVFNCPLNPHAGGCWERLVRSVKKAFGSAVYDGSLHEHTLYSLMCEAENIVNSRPLTHIPLGNPTDEPLTPNHFLIGTPNAEQTPHPHEELYRATRKQWHRVQQMQQRFWRKWMAEYLPELTRRSKWYQPVKPLAIDDVVLVCDENTHRSSWLLGRVIKVFPGKDGQVRAAEVKTSTGIIKRPACVLAKLDVGESGEIHGGGDVVGSICGRL